MSSGQISHPITTSYYEGGGDSRPSGSNSFTSSSFNNKIVPHILNNESALQVSPGDSSAVNRQASAEGGENITGGENIQTGRVIYLNNDAQNKQQQFLSNYISTTKYNRWNFIPLGLMY